MVPQPTWNGYSWVEGNTPNMVDPQGLIPIPPIQICFPFIGCVSGDGNHTGAIGAVDTIGDVASDAIYDVGTGAGNILSDAAILPHMALHEDPDLVRQAIAQYLNGGGCGENWQFAIFGSVALKNPWIRNIIKTPVGVTVGAIGIGIGFGISGLLGINEFHNSLVQDNVRDNVRDDVREDENNNSCDPEKVRQWLQTNMGIPETATGAKYDYQRHYCGLKYRVFGNGERVEADGIDINTCRLLDAKYIANASESPFVINSNARQRMERYGVTARIDEQESDLFRRYAAVLQAPDTENPFVGLDVITNDLASESYWQLWINTHGVPNARIREELWP